MINRGFENIQTRLFEEGYCMLDDKDKYTDVNAKYNFKDQYNYKYFATIKHILAGHKPAFVGRGNPHSIDNIKNWIVIHEKTYTLLSDKFINAHEYIDFYCKECGKVFQRTWNDIYNKHCGCRNCRYLNQSKLQRRPRSGNKWLIEHDEICQDWDYELNTGDISEYSEYSGEKVHCRCHTCGCQWTTAPYHRTKNKSGCPKCSNRISKGEQIIAKILSDNEVDFQREKTFPDCVDKRILMFDFYIPSFNLIIEYDGIQHYKPVRFRKTSTDCAKETFDLTVRHDAIKNKYCADNHIGLIRIPYWHFNNIKEVLNDWFKILGIEQVLQ